jgi:predicted AlkP superfamily phosphohydrolase/phosphomutase
MQGIRINLRGREPNGVVEKGWKYDRLCETIISELYRLKDPHTFENIIERVYRREEIFPGQNYDSAPDIIFVLRDSRYSLQSNKRTNRHYISNANDDYPVTSGMAPIGLFCIMGPSIQHGELAHSPKVQDIAPTILKLLNVQVPGDMEGTVLSHIIESKQNIETKPTIDSKTNNGSQPDKTREIAVQDAWV